VTWRRRADVGLALLALPVVLLVVAAALTPMPPELRVRGTAGSVRVDDRDGNLLREVRADDGTRARWTPLGETGDVLQHAVLAAEDRRFFRHPGVDPVALARAVWLALVHRRIVSGGSTLTMQLARTVRPHPRNLWGKLGEMALAVRIEWSLSKRRVLEEYMNRVSFGPNLRGVGAASQAFFGKSPASLSVAEAALVAGMARGPSLYDVGRRPDRARARRDRVLDRMVADGWLARDEGARGKAEPMVISGRRASFGAPHLVAGLSRGDLAREQPGLSEALSSASPIARVQTTLDTELQRMAETQVAVTVADLRGKGVTAASAVVVDNATGDVLAYVGSPDFFDDEHGGQNDGARALRQPGSTLKPFVYELAMERLGFDPATALPDVDMHLDVGAVHDYAPHDYDGHVRGPVRLREALGNSLNIPAVWTAHALGAAPLLGRLREVGFDSLRQDADYYGPALALGDGEVTLLELARAYATLASEGVFRPLRFVTRVEGVDRRVVELPPADGRRVMPSPLADLVIDILKDHDAREASFGERTVLDFPFDVAAKTGTSKGFRDNWTAGFTASLTVAVWVGNFTGEPMTNVSGVSGAGPMFHAIMEAAVMRRDASGAAREAKLPVDAAVHEGLERVSVCALSGELAGADCPHRVSEWRPAGAADPTTCTMHERVRIDRRNGLRAGAGCKAADAVSRVFERFPPDLSAWAAAAGRPVAPSGWSPSCPGSDEAEAAAEPGDVRIAYPIAGSRFVIDPGTPRELQRLRVQIVAPASAQDATLLVDGREVSRVKLPLAVSWPLEGGEHELVAVAGGVRSPVVRVIVRDDGEGR
jgi:penicillin-binding protein 1C